MARTVTQVYDQIVSKMVAEYAAVGVTIDPDNWSIYSPRRLTCYVIAFICVTVEEAMDSAVALIRSLLLARKTHTLGWYADMAKKFQFGRALVKDQDYYDNTGLTDSQIAAEQVIKYAAASEIYDTEENLKGLRLKVATLSSGDLAPVPSGELTAFKEYMKEVKDAGVKLYIYTAEPDSLKATIDIYYDPLVLNAAGERLDGTNDTPVADAIDDFLLNDIVFDGLFITSKMVDKLQEVEGVTIPHIQSIQAKYGELDYMDIPVKYRPDSGYMRVITPATDLTLNYIAQ